MVILAVCGLTYSRLAAAESLVKAFGGRGSGNGSLLEYLLYNNELCTAPEH